MKLGNPYTEAEEVTHVIQCKVSAADREYLYGIMPFRGTVDAIASQLFKKFITALKNEHPERYHQPDSEEQIISLLERTTFVQTSGD